MDKLNTETFEVDDSELTIWEQTEKYSTFTLLFLWSA